ncbi:hypothetical protein JG688_00014716 [Phytophthora aleatoria]|uniref:Uncharacterized protein n=1 Tax=Phytophthora aleatoria TaxID=2496075 RepID=A0A8J5I7D2_9STRA|nr:hypothetical protein JG688_00014716 [Phytophthora aleatoria]
MGFMSAFAGENLPTHGDIPSQDIECVLHTSLQSQSHRSNDLFNLGQVFLFLGSSYVPMVGAAIDEHFARLLDAKLVKLWFCHPSRGSSNEELLHQAFMAELHVFLLQNLEVAEIVGVLLNLLGYLFSGFSPPASTLPSATVWLYDITPMKYSMAAFSAVVFSDCSNEGDIECTRMISVPPENITVTEA